MADNIEMVSSDIPTDIVFDILSRLPVQTLIRFKSVCKAWNVLIENPKFVETHKNMQGGIELEPTFNNMIVTVYGPDRTKKFHLLHFSEVSRKIILSEFSNLTHLKSWEVVGICNGLVCLRSSSLSKTLIVCNPTTRQFRQIPPFKISGSNRELILGFRSCVNDYELIRILYTWYWGNPVIRVELYTMHTDSWREIDLKFGESISFQDFKECLWDMPLLSDGVVINGVYYWKVEYTCDYLSVAYFDTCQNVFGVIENPCRVVDVYGSICWQLRETKEKLALIMYKGYYKSFDLWELNEDMSWTKKHEIEFGVFPSYLPSRGGKTTVIGSTRNGELVLKNWSCNSGLFLYNPSSQEIKCLHNVEGVIICDAYLCTLSLTPVN